MANCFEMAVAAAGMRGESRYGSNAERFKYLIKDGTGPCSFGVTVLRGGAFTAERNEPHTAS